jgi:predicted DNA-binding transcriptional regulator AlpA
VGSSGVSLGYSQDLQDLSSELFQGESPMDNRSLLDHGSLTCWKDIAQYMGKGVRTVQRWESQLGLPVRRPKGGGPKGPVAADRAEIDQWLSSRWSERSGRKRDSLQRHHDEDLLPGNPLVQMTQAMETSRKLKAENHALLVELMNSLSQLQRTCRGGDWAALGLREQVKEPAHF